ncbi:MAG TPA: ferrous iron transport protein B [Desulfocapsa sulfexigens]|nr:ferrous iron transport protein B [Desulfocapsa sulfexigens]
MGKFTIGIVGNPNCGKTTLFNALTGAKQMVGNWPGVTVDKKYGSYSYSDKHVIEVVDTPGIYSLIAASVDEKIARGYVLSRDADLIVNIVDASNIERNLYLTNQLLEMRVPFIIALNMLDVAKERQLEIDITALSEKFDCPVVPLVLTANKGLEKLKEEISKAALRPAISKTIVTYPPEVEDAVTALIPFVSKVASNQRWNMRWMALRLLEEDDQVVAVVGRSASRKAAMFQQSIEDALDDDIDIVIASANYAFIEELTRDTVRRVGEVKASTSDKIDKVVLNRFLGVPIFFLTMYLMFMFTINLGGAFIDFFDQFFGTIFVDGYGELLTSLKGSPLWLKTVFADSAGNVFFPIGTALHYLTLFGVPVWLITILADGLGGGIQTMATFIPPIGFMFLFLSILEDSGYMARAAFVMDRAMRVLGLPGKSFVPMLVGFGCNVPAIMAARTLENERDRILTVMMNPFMSCGARLPVYALFAAAFFPTGGQNLIFLLYLIGIAFAVFTGLTLKYTLLKGESTAFIMELPPYHVPTVTSVLLRTYDRLKTFLFRAGRVLIPVIMVLAFFNSLGVDGTFGNEDSEKSALASISKVITPVFTPLGVSDENWPATVGLFTGIFAKEAVVGTLNSLYSSMGDTIPDGAEEDGGFWEAIAASFLTIPANLSDLAGTVLDPLGISVGELGNQELVAEEMDVSVGTLGSMVTLFGSKIAAFSYLLFVLLYFPCGAAMAAVYRETNLQWTLFAGFWTTFLAYLASVVFYQIATFKEHRLSSLGWVLGLLLCLVLVIGFMKVKGIKEAKKNSFYVSG